MISKITGNKMILGAVVGIVGGLVVAVLLVVVLGAGGSSAPAEAAKEGVKASPPKAAAKKGAAASAAKFGPTFVIRDRIVNLADPGGRRYLRFTVGIEFEGCGEHAAGPATSSHLAFYQPGLDDPTYQLTAPGSKDGDKEFQAQIKKYAPAIEDIVTVVLSSKSFAEVQGMDGKESVKKEIMGRINQLLAGETGPGASAACALHYPPHVTNVYFNEFVIQ